MLNKILIFLIKFIRPILGNIGNCRYSISCYNYAIEELNQKKYLCSIFRIIKRVLFCNPFININNKIN